MEPKVGTKRTRRFLWWTWTETYEGRFYPDGRWARKWWPDW